jgi:hypothetical protein
VERTSVTSKFCKSIGYDAEVFVLEVELHNGAVYQYPGVTPKEYADLVAAESKGGHFLKHIKPAHEGVRVPKEVSLEHS